MSTNLNSVHHPYDGIIREAKLLLRKYIDDCASVPDQISRVEIEIRRLTESEELDYDNLFKEAKIWKKKIIYHLKELDQMMSSLDLKSIAESMADDCSPNEIENLNNEKLLSQTRHYNLSFLLEEPYPKLYHFVADTKSRVLFFRAKLELMEETELISLLGNIWGTILAYREYISR
jgi:hypothetical protein